MLVIIERQEEVDLLLYKTRTEMHAAFQPDSRSPKQVACATLTSQLKPTSDNGRTSGTFPSQVKGKKRERVDHIVDPVKRERAMRAEDGEFPYKNESKLKFEIARITDKGVVDSDGVKKLVQLMAGERKMDLVSRSMLAGVMAATDRVDCLNSFLQFQGLPVLDEWLLDIHKRNIGDGNSLKESDKTVEEFLLVVLCALDKLPVNLHALQMCNIGRSVNHLRSHKNLEIQKKARSLVDTWKKRIEAEMISIDTRPPKSRLLDAAHGGRRTPSGSEVAMNSSVTQNSSSKTTSAWSSHGESTTKSLTSSPGPVKQTSSSPPSSKKGQPLSSVGDTPDVPLIREDMSSSTYLSHSNSQSFSGKEDGKSPTSGSVIVNKTSGSITRSRKVISFPVSAIESQKEDSSSRSPSAHKTTGLEKFSQPVLGNSEKVLEGSINEGSSHKLIVKIPNRVSSPARGVGGASVEDTAYTTSVLGETHEQFERTMKDRNNVHRNGLKDVLNVTVEGVGSPAVPDEVTSMATEDSRGLIEDPSKTELISKKLHSSSFGPMDALAESCAKYSEATSSLSPGDDIGMNLLASVATGQMSRSDMASPIDSTEKSTHAVEGVCIGDEAKSKYPPNDYVVGVQKNSCSDTEFDEKKHAGFGCCARTEDRANMPKHVAVGFSGDKNCDQFYAPEDISVGHVNNRLDSSSMSLRSNVDIKGEISDKSLEKAGPTPTFPGKVNDGEINEQNQDEVTSSKINDDGTLICNSDGINVVMVEKKNVTNLLCHEGKLTVEVTVPNQFSEGGCKKDVHEIKDMQKILSSPSVKSEISERDTNEKLQPTACVLESGVEVGDKGKLREPDERDVRDCLSKSERPNSDMESDGHATAVLNNTDGSCSTSNDLKNLEEANAAEREISVPVEGDLGSVEHVAQEKAESGGSKSASIQPDEAVECGAEVSSSSAAGTSYVKMKFDLNEDFSNDDGKDEDHVSLLSSGATNVHVINPSQFHVNFMSNGHSASITVAAAAKGPFVPLEDLLKSKGELRWKGSAATSAFQPAEPRKVEPPFGSTSMPCSDASSSKHDRILFDFDLNVPDERLLEEMASRDSSFAVDSATDIVSDRTTLFNKATRSMPVHGFGGLDLDLNRVDEANDNGHCSSSNRDGDASIMHFKAIGGLPSVDVRRNFDLNNGPGVDEAGSDLLSVNQQIKGSMPAQLSSAGLRMNGPGLGSYSSWFPPGNTFSTVAIPSMLPGRGEQSFPIFPPNAPQRTFCPSDVDPFTSDIYRGSVLSASSAMSYPSSPFQFPTFPFGTTFPLPLTSFQVGGNSYADSASVPRLFSPSQLLVPPINSQLLGHVGSVTSQFQKPFMVGLPDSFGDGVQDNNRKWGRQGLDLNAGPGTIGSEARQEMLPLPSVQHSLSSTQALAEEHARIYSVSGGILKRREPDGGLENENFRFKKSSWH